MESVEQTLNLFAKERILPNLQKNIKCGNSLVSTTFYRENFDLDDAKRINVFDYQTEFPAIMDRGGFDCIIGNPPYVQLQKFKGEIYQDALKQTNYKVHHSMGDIYCLFYEKGFSLLKPNSLLGFITSNKWMRAGYGEKLRDFLLKHTSIRKIIDFKGSKIFKTATVDTHIVIYQKQSTKEQKTMGCIPKDFVLSANNLSEQIQKNQFLLASDHHLYLMINHQEKNIERKNRISGHTFKRMGC